MAHVSAGADRGAALAAAEDPRRRTRAVPQHGNRRRRTMDATSPRWQAITGLRFPLGARRARVRPRPAARPRPLPRLVELRVHRRRRLDQRGRSARADAQGLLPGGDQEPSGNRGGRPGNVDVAARGRRPPAHGRQPAAAREPQGEEADRAPAAPAGAAAEASTPFLEAHVFLSHEAVDCRIAQDLRARVHLRDTGTGRDERPGIVAALTRHSAGTPIRTRPDRPMAGAVSRAMQEAGIRPSQRARRVGDYRLDELLFEGPNYQDWTARHAAIDSERARVRIYAVSPSASEDERAACRRAARRDTRSCATCGTRGFSRPGATPSTSSVRRSSSSTGDGSRRFDHWLADRAAALDVDTRLHLLRQIAEAVRFAHAKRLVHRALSPQSILVVDPTRRSRGSASSTGRRGRAGRSIPGRRGRRRRGRAVSTRSWSRRPGSTWRPRR